MALQYAGADIDWNGYCIPNYLYGYISLTNMNLFTGQIMNLSDYPTIAGHY